LPIEGQDEIRDELNADEHLLENVSCLFDTAKDWERRYLEMMGKGERSKKTVLI